MEPLTRQELRALFLEETLTSYYTQMRDEIAQRTEGEAEQALRNSGRKPPLPSD